MPARFLLIDGYNLLHAAGMGQQEYGKGDLQRCRERLLRYLAGKLTPAELDRATVIFDARDPPPDRPAELTFRGVKVQFANPGGDADVVIQDWLARHSAPKRVTLVSSDHELQRAARRHRAEFVDSEEFFDRLERRRRAGTHDRDEAAESKPADGLSPGETAHWMRFFGDLSAIMKPEAPDAVEATEAPAPEVKAGEECKPRPGSRKRRRPADKPEKSRGKKRVSTDDVAYWMEVFGNLPEAQELMRGKGISQSDLEHWLAEFDPPKD